MLQTCLKCPVLALFTPACHRQHHLCHNVEQDGKWVLASGNAAAPHTVHPCSSVVNLHSIGVISMMHIHQVLWLGKAVCISPYLCFLKNLVHSSQLPCPYCLLLSLASLAGQSSSSELPNSSKVSMMSSSFYSILVGWHHTDAPLWSFTCEADGRHVCCILHNNGLVWTGHLLRCFFSYKATQLRNSATQSSYPVLVRIKWSFKKSISFCPVSQMS